MAGSKAVTAGEGGRHQGPQTPDLAVPEEAEIGHPRTAANTMGTASPANQHLSIYLIQSPFLLSPFPTVKRGASPHPFQQSMRCSGSSRERQHGKRRHIVPLGQRNTK